MAYKTIHQHDPNLVQTHVYLRAKKTEIRRASAEVLRAVIPNGSIKHGFSLLFVLL